MIDIGVVVFSLIKSTNLMSSEVFGFTLLAMFVMSAYLKSCLTQVLYCFIVLSNSAFSLIIANLLVIMFFLLSSINKLKLDRTFFLVNVLFLIILLQSLINYQSFYDLLRWVSLFSTWNLIFAMQNQSPRFVIGKMPILFVSLIFANFIYINFISDNVRLSIFSGSENIALMIFLSMSVVLYKTNNKLWILCAILFLYNLESRSIFIIPLILIVVQILYNKGYRFKALIIMPIFVFLFYSFAQYNLESRVSRVFNDVESLLFINDIESLSKIDTRGVLILEGVEKIKEKPIFGHGVIKPDFFKVYEPDAAMATYHNVLIDLLVTYGFAGTMVIFIAIFLCCNYVRIRYDSSGFNLLLVCLISSLFQPYFFNVQVVSFLLCGLLAFKKSDYNA
ncbi:O-antigen ligase family protein [Vibrio fluvialis]|nr:O-antigen ligase family protein [Vibrio fluvialis]